MGGVLTRQTLFSGLHRKTHHARVVAFTTLLMVGEGAGGSLHPHASWLTGETHGARILSTGESGLVYHRTCVLYK